MKHFWKIFAGMTLAALVSVSCGEDSTESFPDKGWGELTTPVLSVSDEEVALDADLADEAALTLSWTSAGDDASIRYELYLNVAGSDLFSGYKREMGSDLTLSLTHGELNTLIMTEFGGRSGERFELRACVYARTDNYLLEEKCSEEAAFAVTTYEAQIIKPASLWMMGGACEFGWDKAIELPQDDQQPGVYTAENVVLKFGKPADNKGFKFYIEQNGSYPFYGQLLEGEFGQIQVFATENDGDSQFYPLQYDYVSGLYTVRVDLNEMQLTLTKTGDVTEFDPDAVLYLLGDNLDYGWTMAEENALLPVGENVYEKTHFYLRAESSFKLYFHDWTEFIRDDSASDYWTLKQKGETDGDIRFIPGDQGLSSGYYTVRADLNAKSVTLTLEGAASAYPDQLYLFGPATSAGWDLAGSIPMTKLRDGVFQARGVEINVGTANPDDNKGNGFKFIISNTDWLTEYGAKAPFDDQDGQPGYRGWELAQSSDQFYPLLMGFESGSYDITADLTTMTVTFTPAGAGDYPGALYILGDAMPGKWELADAVPMTQQTPGVFVAEHVSVSVGEAVEGNPKGNGFKFIISNTEWLTQYGAKESFDEGYRGWELVESGDANQFYPLLMGFSDGEYRITADFTTMTVTFEAQ